MQINDLLNAKVASDHIDELLHSDEVIAKMFSLSGQKRLKTQRTIVHSAVRTLLSVGWLWQSRPWWFN